jgi:hypothetical protein
MIAGLKGVPIFTAGIEPGGGCRNHLLDWRTPNGPIQDPIETTDIGSSTASAVVEVAE